MRVKRLGPVAMGGDYMTRGRVRGCYHHFLTKLIGDPDAAPAPETLLVFLQTEHGLLPFAPPATTLFRRGGQLAARAAAADCAPFRFIRSSRFLSILCVAILLI
ncbi:MAG: hypothetical protein JKP96_04770 [Oceanicaulis sp.]|nr:hypothetical protein [Oceanicaulis sp.]